YRFWADGRNGQNRARPARDRAGSAGPRRARQGLIIRCLRTMLVVGYEARASDAARELAQLQRAWEAGGQLLVVRGRAGIGKSRLVREFAGWVRGAGRTVLAGRCSPAAGDVPF